MAETNMAENIYSMDRKQDGGAHEAVRPDVDVSAADDGMTGSVVQGRY